MQKKLAAPVEQVALARIHVGGGFKLVGRRHEFPVLFFDLTQQVMQFRRVLFLQQILDQLPAPRPSRPVKTISQRQVVAVVVGRRIDLLGLLQKGHGLGNFARADVKLAQVVVGVEIPRLELDRFLELFFRQVKLSHARQIGSEVGSGRRRIRLQAHRRLQVLVGFCVLRLRGIDQSQEFVNFEAFRDLVQQTFQLRRGFCEVARFVLRHCRLELAVQTLSLLAIGCWPRGQPRRRPGDPGGPGKQTTATGDS